jgi:hypothetical protein
MRHNSCHHVSRKAGIAPKLVADQLGHGIGLNLDVYTIADLEQRLAAVDLIQMRRVPTILEQSYSRVGR